MAGNEVCAARRKEDEDCGGKGAAVAMEEPLDGPPRVPPAAAAFSPPELVLPLREWWYALSCVVAVALPVPPPSDMTFEANEGSLPAAFLRGQRS